MYCWPSQSQFWGSCSSSTLHSPVLIPYCLMTNVDRLYNCSVISLLLEICMKTSLKFDVRSIVFSIIRSHSGLYEIYFYDHLFMIYIHFFLFTFWLVDLNLYVSSLYVHFKFIYTHYFCKIYMFQVWTLFIVGWSFVSGALHNSVSFQMLVLQNYFYQMVWGCAIGALISLMIRYLFIVLWLLLSNFSWWIGITCMDWRRLVEFVIYVSMDYREIYHDFKLKIDSYLLFVSIRFFSLALHMVVYLNFQKMTIFHAQWARLLPEKLVFLVTGHLF